MNLDGLLSTQRKLQQDCYPKFMHDNSNEMRLLDNCGHIIHETVEVERELNFKHWKVHRDVKWDRVQDELVDVFIFLMNAFNEAGMDQKVLFDKVLAKQKINRQRVKDGY